MGKQFYAIFKVGRREKLAQNYKEERVTLLFLPARSVKVGFRVQSVIISLSLSLSLSWKRVEAARSGRITKKS